jgi:hypothetical protein
MGSDVKISLELAQYDAVDTEGFADVRAANSAIAAVGPGPSPGNSAIAAVGPGPGGRQAAKANGPGSPLVSWSQVAVSDGE